MRSSDLLADDTSAEIHQWQWFRIEATDVLHGDFAVPPDGGHDRVQLSALQAPECHPQILAVDDKAEGALVHVERDQKFVRHEERLVGLKYRGIRHAGAGFRVVVQHIAPQVPAPALVVRADQTLITYGV